MDNQNPVINPLQENQHNQNNVQNFSPEPVKKSHWLRYVVLSILTVVIIFANIVIYVFFTFFAVCKGEGSGCPENVFVDAFFVLAALVEIVLLWYFCRPKKSIKV